MASLASSAALLFAAPTAPLSQPRNVIGGHLICALSGVASYKWIAVPMGTPWLAVPVSVAAAIVVMQATKTLHPPGGGTTLVAVLGSDMIHHMGFGLLVPTFSGASILVISATVFNNLYKDRRYPLYW